MLALCTRLSGILVHAFQSSSLITVPILAKNGNEAAAFLVKYRCRSFLSGTGEWVMNSDVQFVNESDLYNESVQDSRKKLVRL